MARINNLTNFLTDVASAIKEKKGSQNIILASDFDTEIRNLPSSGGFPPDWTLIGYSTTPTSVIDNFNYTKDIYDNWDSSKTDLTSKFVNNKTLYYLPFIDTSNATIFASFCQRCDNLVEIPLLNTSNATNMASMFNGCASLIYVPLLNTANLTNMNNMFNSCYKLNNESLNNILMMCANATNYAQTKTLKAIAISSTQATICTELSNYQAFLNAGWTTGY